MRLDPAGGDEIVAHQQREWQVGNAIAMRDQYTACGLSQSAKPLTATKST